MMTLTLTLSLTLGGLLAEPGPRSAALLSRDEVMLAQAPAPLATPGDRATLQARFDLLQASPAPSLGPPIALLAGALASVGVGVVFLYLGVLASILVGPGSVAALLIVGAVALVLAAGLGIGGGSGLARFCARAGPALTSCASSSNSWDRRWVRARRLRRRPLSRRPDPRCSSPRSD